MAEVEEISRIISPSTRKVYTLSRVCRVWRLPRSTFYSQRQRTRQPDGLRQRPGPVGPCSDEMLVEHIRTVLTHSPFSGEGYRKVWARLRFRGIHTSKRRVLRLMRQHGLLAPQRRGRSPGPRHHDGTIITQRINDMWGTDLTSTMTVTEGKANIFFAIDHCSLECVGIHAAPVATRFEALEPIRQGVRNHFGAFGAEVAQGLSLRHDHGSQYISRDFQAEIAFLGIKSSPAFVRAPEGNGCAERFVRTLKENLLWVKTFQTIEELRRELLLFQRLYNESWIIARHGYKSPMQVRQEQLRALALAAA